MQDGPAGMRYQWFNSASAFTSSLNLAATWDKELVKEAAQAMGEEFKAKGVNGKFKMEGNDLAVLDQFDHTTLSLSLSLSLLSRIDTHGQHGSCSPRWT